MDNSTATLILFAFALHCITVYAVAKLNLTGKAAVFERKDVPHD